jgi:EmrB/QacA subfamily drug resistance transporter
VSHQVGVLKRSQRHETGTSQDARHPPSARPGVAVFVLTGLGGFLVSLDVSIANSLLPAIGADFRNADRAASSWIITAYAIVFAATLVPAGRLADRAGRRRIYVAGLLTFAVGSGICGTAPDLGLLLGGRVIQGIGAAAASPASLGLLLAATDARHRSLYTARWIGAAAFGVCLGPLIGGVLTDTASWRWAFLVNIPLVIIAVAAAPRILPETARHPGRRLPDPIGAVLLALAAAALTLGISEATTWGLVDVRTTACVITGLGLAALFARRCSRVVDPLLDLGLLKQRRVAQATLTTCLYASGFFGLLLTFVLFLVGTWHLSLVRSGLALLPIGLVVIAITVGVGHLAEWVGFRLPLVVGSACMAAGLLLSAVLEGGHRFSSTWVILGVFLGVGIGLCYPLLGAAAVADLPSSELAAATAVNQCARQMGSALGIAVAVAVLGPANPVATSRFHAAWVVCAGFCAAAAVAAALMPRSARAHS